jgi:hypothetical protein
MSLSGHSTRPSDTSGSDTGSDFDSKSHQHPESLFPVHDLSGDNTKQRTISQFYQQQLGVWTLYFPPSESWAYSIPSISWKVPPGIVRNTRMLCRFAVEAISVQPVVFGVYFITLMTTSIVVSIQLHYSSKIMHLVNLFPVAYQWTYAYSYPSVRLSKLLPVKSIAHQLETILSDSSLYI